MLRIAVRELRERSNEWRWRKGVVELGKRLSEP